MLETFECQFGRTHTAADLFMRFEYCDLRTGLRQHNGRGKPIGA